MDFENGREGVASNLTRKRGGFELGSRGLLDEL